VKTELQSLNLTLVDFMASFLSGAIWFVLLSTFVQLPLLSQQSASTTPVDVVYYIVNTTTATNTYQDLLYIAIFIIVAYVLGYLLNQVGTRVAESICFLDALWKSKRTRVELDEYHFPYNAIFRSKSYFASIIKYLKTYLHDDFESLPGKQPYSTCKRVLKAKNSILWEESERTEADVRMVGSLFLAALFSAVSAVASMIMISPLETAQVIWLVISLIAALILGFTFRDQRTREVAYTYLNFLIALGLEQQEEKTNLKNRKRRNKN